MKGEGETEKKGKMPAMKNAFPKQWKLPGVCQVALLSLSDPYSPVRCNGLDCIFSFPSNGSWECGSSIKGPLLSPASEVLPSDTSEGKQTQAQSPR